MKALLASIPINIHYADYTTNPMQTQCCFVVHHTSSARPPQVWSADPREVRRWNGETWNFAVEKSTLLDGWMSMFCLTKLAQLVGRFRHLEYRNMPFLNPFWWLDCSGENIWWVYCSLCPPQKRHLPLSSIFACHNVAWIYWEQHRQISELQSWLSISEFN